jgi:phosphonate transport system ATP-binding protein
MDYLKEISTKFGITCLVNLHQVEVALRYSDRIIGINKGEKVFDGRPKKITEEIVQNIYGSESKELILS